jgi:hypothetical protein
MQAAVRNGPRPTPAVGLALPDSPRVVSPVPDGVDLHSVFVLVDAIDDAVGSTPCGVVAVEGLIQWLSGAVRVGSERPVDRLMAAAATSSGRFSCGLRLACREKMTTYGDSASDSEACGSPVMIFRAAA